MYNTGLNTGLYSILQGTLTQNITFFPLFYLCCIHTKKKPHTQSNDYYNEIQFN